MQFINKSALDIKSTDFINNKPYSHIVIDHFFHLDTAKKLSKSFPDYNNKCWHIYKNAIEDKKTLNTWNHFDSLQYKVFSELNSPEFIHFLKKISDSQLYPDHGLHGGGLHIHSDEGNLNPHLDYSIHPKTGLQRKINVIVYLETDFREEYGGAFGLWSPSSQPDKPGELVKKVIPFFNRAVIIDTTQNSWHGMCQKLTLPKGKYRKSFASYYLQVPKMNAESRTRALFAPRKDQMDNKDVLELIRLRSKEGVHSKAYVSSLGLKSNEKENSA